MSGREVALVVVDDDSMVRGWVRLSLEGSEFRIAGEAASVADTPELVRRRAPDLLLVDYRLQDGTGTELVRALRAEGLRARAVIMTANNERGLNEAVREAGAHGTVLKTGSPDELLAALRLVVNGHTAFDARHPPREAGRAALTPRERDVLRLIARGSTNREVAAELALSEETVKTLLSRACTKLGVRRRTEAVATAQKRGLL